MSRKKYAFNAFENKFTSLEQIYNSGGGGIVPSVPVNIVLEKRQDTGQYGEAKYHRVQQ